MTNLIEIIDVGPRDGLQSQPKLLDTKTKLEFIGRLIDAGIRRMEVVSFVNPKRVPQMADTDELVPRLPKHDDVTYIGLVLNMKGFERAVASSIDEVNCVGGGIRYLQSTQPGGNNTTINGDDKGDIRSGRGTNNWPVA